MCAHYEIERELEYLQRRFGVAMTLDEWKRKRSDVWPGYEAVMIRRPPEANVGDEAVPAHEGLVAMFGLLPHWAKDAKLARNTYNARSETVASKPSFRDAWKRAQHCVIPADAIYEPDWRSGKAIPTRISRADGEMLSIAGLWSSWRPAPTAPWTYSFTILTINATDHPVMRNFHRPEDEKRMVVILEDDQIDAWLGVTPEESGWFLRQYGAERLVTEARPATKPTGRS